MRDAEKLAPDALPPICAEFGTEVADGVVVELRFHPEEETTLFFAVHFYTFARCFEVQEHAYEVATAIPLQKGALHIQCSGKADAFWHLAKGIGIADGAVED